MNVPLYLAVPEDVFTNDFDSVVQSAFQSSQIKQMIVNLATETITRWIE